MNRTYWLSMGASAALASTLALGGCGDDPDDRGADRGAATTTSESTAVDGAYGAIEEAYTGSGPEVVVLGDSITVASRDQLRTALSDHAVKIAAIQGEGLSAGPVSAATGGDPMPEVAATYGRDDPAVVVVALGTNDAWAEELTEDAAERALTAIVDEFPESCIVTVSISEEATTGGYDQAAARRINAALAAVADVQAPWGQESVRDAARYLESDGIHPTPEGSALLARLVGDAVGRCTG